MSSCWRASAMTRGRRSRAQRAAYPPRDRERGLQGARVVVAGGVADVQDLEHLVPEEDRALLGRGNGLTRRLQHLDEQRVELGPLAEGLGRAGEGQTRRSARASLMGAPW